MQALCQWEVQREQTAAALAQFFADREALPAAQGYARELVEAYWADMQRIDGLIAATAHHWQLGRISPVERNLMRVAVGEMTAALVPGKVVINEAVEIARSYGGAESPRFVNGVLDRVLHTLAAELARARGDEPPVERDRDHNQDPGPPSPAEPEQDTA